MSTADTHAYDASRAYMYAMDAESITERDMWLGVARLGWMYAYVALCKKG